MIEKNYSFYWCLSPSLRFPKRRSNNKREERKAIATNGSIFQLYKINAARQKIAAIAAV